MESTNFEEQARERHRNFTAKFDRVLGGLDMTDEELAEHLHVSVPVLHKLRTKAGHKTNALPLIKLLTEHSHINAEYLIREDETPTLNIDPIDASTLLETTLHWQRQVHYLKQSLQEQKQGAIAGRLERVIELMNELQGETSQMAMALAATHHQLQGVQKLTDSPNPDSLPISKA